MSSIELIPAPLCVSACGPTGFPSTSTWSIWNPAFAVIVNNWFAPQLTHRAPKGVPQWGQYLAPGVDSRPQAGQLGIAVPV